MALLMTCALLAAGPLASLGAAGLAATSVASPVLDAAPGAMAPTSQEPAPDVLFEKNLGQWRAEAHYKARAAGYEAFLAPGRLAIVLAEAPADAQAPTERPAGPPVAAPSRRAAVFLHFEGADPTVVPSEEGLQAYRTNYFPESDPTTWVTDVPHFSRIVYRMVYPGIDLVYHGDGEGGVKYDFILHPGASPDAIRLRFEGLDGMRLEGDGSLALQTAVGTFRHGAPVTFQEGATLQRVPNRYAVRADGTLGFEVGAYDPARPLVIDPLVSSTYLGGSGYDGFCCGLGPAVAVDSSRNTYVTGMTESSDFPIAGGAYDPTFNGAAHSENVFVTKFNATGSGLVYSTFLGNGRGAAIAVDNFGNVYVTGAAWSSFPTTLGAYDTTHNGNYDVFVTKLAATGSSLLYSTFIGAINDDFAASLAIDGNGNVYLAGGTSYGGFPTTSGAYDRTYNGESFDVFVTKLNALGTSLLYSTYVGGSGKDFAESLALDINGNAYVAGWTGSTDYPTTAGAHRTSYAGGAMDAVVTKLDAAGSALVYSTYLGGAGRDEAHGIVVGLGGNAYVAGSTDSSAFPTTSGAYDTTASGTDAFVTKLDAAGTGLAYSTFVGGAGTEKVLSMALDSNANAYVVGYTTSSDYPTVTGAYQRTYAGGTDAILARLDASGSTLVYSTYLGGTSCCGDYATGLALSLLGDAHVVGLTASSDFPTTSGAYDRTFNDVYDFFMSRLLMYAPVAPRSFAAACAPEGILLSWSPPPGVPIVEYRVYHGTTNPPTSVQVVSGSTTSWTHQPPWSTTLYYYQVSAVNAFGEGYKTAALSWYPCDSVAPAVSGSPQSWSWRSSVPTLSGVSWQDGYAGLKADVQYSVGTTGGGTDVAGWTALPTQPSAGQTSPWSPSWSPPALAQGRNHVNMRVSDLANNLRQTSGAYVVDYDTTAPTSSGAPVTWAWTSANPTLSGVCFQDPHSGLAASATYRVGSAAGGSDYLASTPMPVQPTPGQTASWCPSFQVSAAALRQGSNHVTIQVADALGASRTTQAYVIRYDTQSETIATVSAKTGAGGADIPQDTWQTDNTPRFEWSVPASTSPISGYSFTLDASGSTPDTVADTTSAFHDRAGSPLPDGTWRFQVRPQDTAANWGPATGPFVLKVDATPPDAPSVSSSTHPDQALYYNRTALALAWSASDATSGVDGYSYDLVTGPSPPALDSTKDAEEGTTGATFGSLGPFGVYTFRIKALDHAGNWGPVSSFTVRVDAVSPTIDSVTPGPGSTTGPLQSIVATFSDTDGGADLGSAGTWVDPATVELLVDGVDVIEEWGDTCAPGGPVLTCRVEVDRNHVRYDPLLPWSEGLHTVVLTLKDTAVDANARTYSWTWTVAAT